MDAPLLSIVVPVWNVARWLPAFLRSLAAQRFADREILLVDDGSSDGSAALLDEFARAVPGTRVLRQANAGVSVARNRGLEAARGRYVAFADPDDVLAPDLYSALMELALGADLDIAIGNGEYLRRGRADGLIYRTLEDTGTARGIDWLARAIRARELRHVIWLKVYRREFLRRHRCAFIPGLVYRQDIPWTTCVLSLAERVRYVPRPLYLYRVGERTEGDARRRELARSAMSVVEALDAMLDADPLRFAPALRELHWQIAHDGFAVYRQIGLLANAADRAALLAETRERGIDRLLLRHARGPAQTLRALRRMAKLRLELRRNQRNNAGWLREMGRGGEI